MADIRIGVVGFGEWGPNHVRSFLAMPEVTFVGVADGRPERLQAARLQYRGIATYDSHTTMLKEARLNALVVATPTSTHAQIVREALDAGVHVLCEKPLCSNVDDANEIAGRASSSGRVVMVGHVFLFNPGILKLRELLRTSQLGTVRYLTARRTNLGPIRSDVNASWDLASHDISIMNFLLDAVPTEVSAVGHGYLGRPSQDVVFMTFTYPAGVLANVHVSWLDPVKVREITAVGDAKMAVWNDLAGLGPVRIFDKGVVESRHYSDFGGFQLLTREGDVTIPRVVMEEPLRVQARAFMDAIAAGQTPISDTRFGAAVVKVLAAVDESMARNGVPVKIVR